MSITVLFTVALYGIPILLLMHAWLLYNTMCVVYTYYSLIDQPQLLHGDMRNEASWHSFLAELKRVKYSGILGTGLQD